MTTPQIVFDAASIAARVEQMARDVAARKPENLLAVPIMTGAFVFAADFLRALHRAGVGVEVDFLQISSYGAGTSSSGRIEMSRDIMTAARGRDVLLIDDILESGRTLAFARDLFSGRGANRVMIAVALEKPHKREIDIAADFIGFDCPDRFVVGYGMDYAGRYRELPYIGVIEGV